MGKTLYPVGAVGSSATGITGTVANSKHGLDVAIISGGGGSSAGTLFFDADGDNSAQVLKASAGTLQKLHIHNSNGSDAFVQLFDVAAGSVTVGTTTPDYVIFVPSGGGVIEDFASGAEFATAITYACTTTTTGSGDPTTGLTISGTYL